MIPGLISRMLPSLIADVDAVLGSMCKDAWDGAWYDQFTDGKAFRLLTKHDIHDATDNWRNATRAVMDDMADLLGVDRVKVQGSTVIIKPPRDGQAFPPHQDSAYYGKKGEDAVIALFHLDDTYPENGPIRYLDGSHAAGVQPHVREGKKWLRGVKLEDMTEVCARAGDVVCSSIHTVHGSFPNRSEKPRRLVRVVYVGTV